MLELDASDPGGLRRYALPLLLHAGEDEAALAMLKGYGFDFFSTFAVDLHYNLSLLKFRLQRDTIFSRRRLAGAVLINPEVVPYLLGEKSLPHREPKSLDLRPEAQAQHYAWHQRELWEQTPGALDWLRERHAEPAGSTDPVDPTSDGPRFLYGIVNSFDYCPECEKEMLIGRHHLAVLIEPGKVLIAHPPGRTCPGDHLLMIDYVDLEPLMADTLEPVAPELINNDYVPLGIVQQDDAMRLGRRPLDPTEVEDRIIKFREMYEPPEPEFDDDFSWLPTPEKYDLPPSPFVAALPPGPADEVEEAASLPAAGSERRPRWRKR